MRHFKKPYKKRKVSRKDYSQRKSLGAVPSTLPDELSSITRILDQGQTPSCTAYTCVEIRESMLPNLYDPELQWQAELDFIGNHNVDGVELQDALACCVEKGFFRQGETEAKDRASAYVFIRKEWGLDWFDTVKQRIWLLYQKYGKVIPVSCGVNWYSEWDFSPQGIIPNAGNHLLGGHDVKIAGWQKYNGVDYLLLQNSWGENFGDKGVYRISRDVFNKWFDSYGAGYIVDDPDVQIQRYGLMSAFLQHLVSLYQALISQFNQPVAPLPPAPVTPTPVTPPIPPTTHVSRIKDLAKGIFDAEGNGKQAGMALNNRGDLKYTDYTKSLGAISAGANNFAVFRTMADGDSACEQLCRDAASDKLKAYKSTMTLSQFCAIYGEPPVLANYVNTVLKYLPNCTADTQIKELL